MDSKINVGADKKKIEQSNFFTVREFSCTPTFDTKKTHFLCRKCVYTIGYSPKFCFINSR